MSEIRADELLGLAADAVRDRRGDYGPPGDHFARTIAGINAILGHKLREPLTVEDWPVMMIIDKLARSQGPSGGNPDNPVDVAGYAGTWAEVRSCSIGS